MRVDCVEDNVGIYIELRMGFVERERWKVNKIESRLCRDRGLKSKLNCVWVVLRERVGM